MADPLSIAASIVGVSAAGFKVAQGLYNIASSIGSAGEEIRLFASDTDVFSHMLYSLSETLESTPSFSNSPRLLITTEDAVRLCEQVLQPFEKIIARLNPLLVRFKESERKLRQLGLRIRWVFREKSKVLFYQRMLNSLKATLTCLLASMNLNVASNAGVEKAALLRMQVENAQGVIRHNVEILPGRLLESGSSTLNHYPGRALPDTSPESRSDTNELDEDAFIVRRSDAESSISRPEPVRATQDDLGSDEAFDRQIDDDLRNLPGSSSRSAQALYEDIRSLQRKIIEFANESLRATEELPPPTYDVQVSVHDTRSDILLAESTHTNTSPSDVDRQALSIIMPYRTLSSDKPTRGLNLVELRERNQILLEDTLGNILYVPRAASARWESLRSFIADWYSYALLYSTETTHTSAAMGTRRRSHEPFAVRGNNTIGHDYSCGYYETPLIYALLPSTSFQTEHGVTMQGDQKLYLKHAFQRAIERDQYRLEDHSGNGAHVQNVFRKENWVKRTWLNSQLLLRFDNPFFNRVEDISAN